MNQSTSAKTAVFLLVVIPFIIPGAHAAEVFKWVDEQGNVTYSQRPPPKGQQTETITTRSGSAIDKSDVDARMQKQIKMAEDAQEDRTKRGEEQQQAQAEQAKKQQMCENARRRVASYQRPRVNKVDADGSRSRATEEERQAELQRAEAAVKELCQ